MLSPDYDVYYKEDKPKLDNPLHYHDFLEIYYHQEGDCDYIIDSRIFPLKNGDIVVIRSQQLHKAVIRNLSQDYKRYVVWIDNSYVGRALSPLYSQLILENHEGSELLRLPEEHSRRVLLTMKNMMTELGSKHSTAVELVRVYLTEILLLLCKYMDTQDSLKTVLPQQDQLVKEVMEYLDMHIQKKVSLDLIAQHFYINKYSLMRKFKQHTQMTVMDYLEKKRLMTARNLIVEGQPIKEINKLCGFEDYSNFYRAFKATYHMSPREYRKYMNQGSNSALTLNTEGMFIADEH